MDKPTNYKYSINNSIITIIMILVLGAFFTSDVYKAYYTGDRFNLILFGLLVIVLTSILVLIVSKRLIPALQTQTILEFNETEIIDYLRNITISWQDISAIDYRRSRSSAFIVLVLKWESDYGKEIEISLRWVKGNDKDIYTTALTYFNQFPQPPETTV